MSDCLCGATDCPRCNPGYWLYWHECPDCLAKVDPEQIEDESCPHCGATLDLGATEDFPLPELDHADTAE